MPSNAPVSPAVNARIVHAALVTGILMFWLAAWYLGRAPAMPTYALPDRRVLYIALLLVSATLFGAAMFTASRLGSPAPGMPPDEWWRVNLGKAVTIWALIEAPALLGLVAFTLTQDVQVLIATLAGLLLFGRYRPSRLIER
jgi:hypothetical protein